MSYGNNLREKFLNMTVIFQIFDVNNSQTPCGGPAKGNFDFNLQFHPEEALEMLCLSHSSPNTFLSSSQKSKRIVNQSHFVNPTPRSIFENT